MSTDVTEAGEVEEYLTLAEDLLAAARHREPERMRLTHAAHAASDLAAAARDEHCVGSGYLARAAEVLRGGLDGPLEATAALTAGTYLSMARTWAARRREVR
ncbi:hypothetical protein [Saccharopolyspora cebuensis]|uniref:hypothetical protein n=1 Tax=Saccharopolyspora cebuensis TaxID=418759 RepID=UPI0031EA817C